MCSVANDDITYILIPLSTSNDDYCYFCYFYYAGFMLFLLLLLLLHSYVENITATFAMLRTLLLLLLLLSYADITATSIFLC
jgi:hypothetical protein